jgi:hypothetical protein
MPAAPTIRWRSFALHREGNQPDEYEDAFAGNPRSGRFAVADGASESSFAGLWAKLLAEGFIAGRRQPAADSWFTPLRRGWAEEVDHLDLDWFAEEKRQLGAFATFLGLSLNKPRAGEEGRWRALAVGDCCLFQVRDNRLTAAFPLRRSADFNNRPPLLCSRAVGDDPANQLSRARKRVGRWKAGDRFFLMTDALAQWFLRRREEGRRPWQALARRLAGPDTAAGLTAFVGRLRRRGALANDDVTLLVVEP